jgi:hypothetical protein
LGGTVYVKPKHLRKPARSVRESLQAQPAGGYKTKQRYAEAFKRFLAFLAEHYRLERTANIAPKKVANLLGHDRDDVTKIYLASLCAYRTNTRA